MKFKFLVLIIFVFVISCSKDDESVPLLLSDFKNYVNKVIPTPEGYWLVTRTVQNSECEYCSSINFIDGLAYFMNDKVVSSKDKLGYFLDAELNNDNINSLIVITSKEIINYNQSLEKTVLKTAGSDEVYKLMATAPDGKCWILSNKSIFNLNGEKITFLNNLTPASFNITKSKSFWISTSDSVFEIKNTEVKNFDIQKIAGPKTDDLSIYNLAIDKNDEIWINTSNQLFRYSACVWNKEKAGTYTGENFKTIPFMDVDNSGRIWIAERNYQSFTDLHCFDGTSWKSYSLNPTINDWINDIEVAEEGYIWIATNNGLQKHSIN